VKVARRKGVKVCRKCKAIVDKNVNKCPICGSESFTVRWDGMILIIDTDSYVAKYLGISKEGEYAIQIF
jgi:DNA-directed RNA polymerase subunit E"